MKWTVPDLGIEISNRVRCDACLGSGLILARDDKAIPARPRSRPVCPACKGDGTVPKKETK